MAKVTDIGEYRQKRPRYSQRNDNPAEETDDFYKEDYERPLPKYSQRRVAASQQDTEVHYRIKWWMAACLIGTALLVDGLETLLTYTGVGAVISIVLVPVIGFGFWLWLKLLGVSSSTNLKSWLRSLLPPIFELIPFLDAIPLLSFMWTIGMIVTVVMTRSEDKGGIIGKAAGMLQGNIKKAA